MSYDYVAMGWPAFRLVEKVCRQWECLPEELEHRYTEENYISVRAVFEVVRRG